jgi:hypothetical protein
LKQPPNWLIDGFPIGLAINIKDEFSLLSLDRLQLKVYHIKGFFIEKKKGKLKIEKEKIKINWYYRLFLQNLLEKIFLEEKKEKHKTGIMWFLRYCSLITKIKCFLFI